MDQFIPFVFQIPSGSRCGNKDCSAELKYRQTFVFDDRWRPYCHRVCMDDAQKYEFVDEFFAIAPVAIILTWLTINF